MPGVTAFIASEVAATLWVTTSLSAGADIVLADTIAAAVVVGAEIGASAAVQAVLGSPTPDGLRQTVRQTLPPRRRGVGTARIGGALLLDYGIDNTLREVIAFCDGPFVPTNYYLNQDEVRLNGNAVDELPGGAYGPYNDAPSVELDFALGVQGTPIFAFYNPIIPGYWPSSCSATGIFCGSLRAQGGNMQTFNTRFPRGSPKLNIAGQIGVAFDWRDSTQSQTDPSTWKNTANPVVGLVHELWCYRGYSWALDFLPTLDILTAEADYCDQPINYLNVLAKVVVFTGAGGDSVDIAPTAPTPPVGVTLYLGGQQVTVTGTVSTAFDGVECKQVSFSGGPLASNSTVGSLVRWQATPANPETEPTYACGGAWNVGEREADTVKRFLDTMDGWMMRRGSDGAVVIRAGHYYAPTVTIGADEVIGYTWQPFVEAGRTVNQILPAFICPALDYNQVDTTPWQDDAEITINGLSSQKFEPDMVQSNGQVMRLAKRRLHRLLSHCETLTLKASGIRIMGERFITLALGDGEVTELADQVVEIIGDVEILDGGMAVQVQVQPADPTIDEWDCYTDEGNGPAATNAAGAGALTALTAAAIGSISTSALSTSAGTSGLVLEVDATPPAPLGARTDLTWWLQWRLTGSSGSWNQASYANLAAGAVTLTSGFVPTDVSLDVQVAYQTGGRQMSAWSATTAFTASSSSIPPASPTGAAATSPSAGEAAVTWRNPTSTNFDHARVYRGTTATFTSAADVSGALPGAPGASASFTQTGLSSGTTYYYWVAAENAANAQSAAAGPVAVTVS